MHVHRIAAFTLNGRGGNPAGVVLADALPDSVEMQALAAEVGYSETAFAARNEDGSWRVRYFAPESEVPFCGHATIALGAVLARVHGAGRYTLQLNDATITVEGIERDGEIGSVLNSPPTRSEPVSPELLTEALSLFGYEQADLALHMPVRRAHAGADHLIIPLNSRRALAALHYDLDAGRSFMLNHGFVTVAFVFGEGERHFHVRNAFASGGVLEDPATGAAAAAFAGMLRDLELMTPGGIVIIQGEDMGRPSRIEAEFTGELGFSIRVSGASSTISDE